MSGRRPRLTPGPRRARLRPERSPALTLFLETTMKRSVLALAALSLLVLAVGCKGIGGTTSVKTLLDDPGLYDKKTVRVAGDVGPSMGLLNYGAYQLDDGTGTITVVTQSNGAPRQGAKVAVEGEFRSAYTLGGSSAAVIIEARRRDLK